MQNQAQGVPPERSYMLIVAGPVPDNRTPEEITLQNKEVKRKTKLTQKDFQLVLKITTPKNTVRKSVRKG